MAAANKKNYSIEELETKHNEITALYDFAEELVNTVESEFVQDQHAQLDIVEPLISELGDATDILSQEFILIAESHKRKGKGKGSKSQVEGALRKIFTAINDYQARVKDLTKKSHGAIMNIADPIVKKIQNHVEQIVVTFLEFIQISLQSIMGQAELAALKARDSRVALMMHQHAMAQQQ